MKLIPFKKKNGGLGEGTSMGSTGKEELDLSIGPRVHEERDEKTLNGKQQAKKVGPI